MTVFKAVLTRHTDIRCLHEHHKVGNAIKCARRLRFDGIICFDPELDYIRTISGKFIYRREKITTE